MLKVGFIGWRGMVGSVLMSRMSENNDFRTIDARFFSTSNVGGIAPNFGQKTDKLLDAYDIKELDNLDCIVTMQGSDYTFEILPKLKEIGYAGFFIDASSALRMNDESILLLDPINYDQILHGIKSGAKIYCGANCTVSLMLLAIAGLIKDDLVEWINSQTYQAASGAGANNMHELLTQCGVMYNSVANDLLKPEFNILDIEKIVNRTLMSDKIPTDFFKAPLAGNILPFIDSELDNGQSKEEWKAMVETNKLLSKAPGSIKIDGNCVRVGSLRSHAQALTIKLKTKDIPLLEIEDMIKNGNQWVRFVENNKAATIKNLTPVSVSGTLDIAIGRVRKLNLGEDYLSAFTVGDQLLWGAAEPLRRMINILVKHK